MLIKTDPDTLENYKKDASNFSGNLDCVYIPENKDELGKALAECYAENRLITISGAGTGLVGARVPLGGAVISTEKLNKVLSIDTEKPSVTAQSGAIVADLQRAIGEKGFFYAPNPTEINSTIGGNIAANSSGARTFKYGQTRRYVRSLKAFLPDGDEFHLERGACGAIDGRISFKTLSGREISFTIPPVQMPKVKHAAGYYFAPDMDAIDLLVGSEGTLAVIYEATLGILPLPERVLGLITFFDNESSLLDYVEIVRDKSLVNNKFDSRSMSDISARLVEFFDSNALALLRNKYSQLPENAVGAIWTEQEYSDENEDAIMEKWLSLISEHTPLSDATWVAMNEKEHENFRQFRHELPLQIVELLGKNKQIKFNPDGSVPNEHLRDFYYFIKKTVAENRLQHVIFGHIGNNHYHANVFVKSDEDLKRADKFYEDCVTEALRLGGTASAEHGIGKLKTKYLLQMFGADGIAAMKQIKALFDPKNLLGINTLF
jgi:D-lactate dehydrogenase (cytochrome)